MFINNSKSGHPVLVVSPHPDDETIGCGGTLRKHVVDGDQLWIMFLTSGENGGHGRSPHETLALREREATAAAAILGAHEIEFCRERDGALSLTDSIAARLAARIDAWRPKTIYVPHAQEMHPDHRAAVDIVRDALPRTNLRPDVLMFEVWTPVQRLDEVVDISPYMETKREAIRSYESQCAVVDFEQAIVGLNRYRGEMHSWPGGDYAEVFTRLEW